MRKIIVAVFTILLILAVVSTIGCKQKTKSPSGRKQATIAEIDVKRYSDMVTVVGTPRSTIAEARESVEDTLKTYFETAFLDLDSASKANFQEEVLSFFSEDIKAKAQSELIFLSIKSEGTRLNSIINNNLKAPLLAISYDKSKKPVLSTVNFEFTAKYKIKEKSQANLKTFGWLALVKEGEDWKIFDYWVQSSLK